MWEDIVALLVHKLPGRPEGAIDDSSIIFHDA